MLKNLKTGSKLILVGTLLMILPLAVVSIFAIQRSTLAIAAIKLTSSHARHIAGSINSVLQEEECAAIMEEN
jgi:hypothetical protein